MKKFANWLFRKTHNDELLELARFVRVPAVPKSDDFNLKLECYKINCTKTGVLNALEILKLLK